MRCEGTREILEESRTQEVPAAIKVHLASCSSCQAYAREWQVLRAGFRVLAEKQVPEASLGFSARLVRRLQDTADPLRSKVHYLEQAGRRFVYAASLLTLMLGLGLVLPSSGPLRGPTNADLYLAQTEVTPAENDPLLAPDWQDNRDAIPADPTSEGDKRQ